ncbi:hypothetical protein NEIPOLOT_01614 [Neisseria polysaccharea ATCC 43768]|nr:hypothetical protein NEIPOLOT_01614 [Neisseria polysaccharea ATCC 43768]
MILTPQPRGDVNFSDFVDNLLEWAFTKFKPCLHTAICAGFNFKEAI